MVVLRIDVCVFFYFSELAMLQLLSEVGVPNIELVITARNTMQRLPGGRLARVPVAVRKGARCVGERWDMARERASAYSES